MAPTALAGVREQDQDAALERASALADSYLAQRYPVPLARWGGDLLRVVCDVAAYDLLTQKPINVPAEPWTPRVRYEDALRWLDRVARGELRPSNLPTSTEPPRRTGAPVVLSDKPRGWN
jgi:phage gp36-like protein